MKLLKNKKFVTTFIIILGVFVVIKLILLGYSASWTGFNEQVNVQEKKSQIIKTLWDWLQLLIIPLSIGFGSVILTSYLNRDRELSEDNQHEIALQGYLDAMSELMLKRKLTTSPTEEVRQIAQVRTLTLLNRLDVKRKKQVVQFLSDSHLINEEYIRKKTKKPVFALTDVDLSNTDLREIYFTGAYLSGANMTKADLRKTHLRGAAIDWANLSKANLAEAELNGAFLWLTDLSGANLSGADLSNTHLIEANLYGANLTNIKLKDALYDESTVWPKGFTPPPPSKRSVEEWLDKFYKS